LLCQAQIAETSNFFNFGVICSNHRGKVRYTLKNRPAAPGGGVICVELRFRRSRALKKAERRFDCNQVEVRLAEVS